MTWKHKQKGHIQTRLGLKPMLQVSQWLCRLKINARWLGEERGGGNITRESLFDAEKREKEGEGERRRDKWRSFGELHKGKSETVPLLHLDSAAPASSPSVNFLFLRSPLTSTFSHQLLSLLLTSLSHTKTPSKKFRLLLKSEIHSLRSCSRNKGSRYKTKQNFLISLQQ